MKNYYCKHYIKNNEKYNLYSLKYYYHAIKINIYLLLYIISKYYY